MNYGCIARGFFLSACGHRASCTSAVVKCKGGGQGNDMDVNKFIQLVSKYPPSPQQLEALGFD